MAQPYQVFNKHVDGARLRREPTVLWRHSLGALICRAMAGAKLCMKSSAH